MFKEFRLEVYIPIDYFNDFLKIVSMVIFSSLPFNKSSSIKFSLQGDIEPNTGS